MTDYYPNLSLEDLIKHIEELPILPTTDTMVLYTGSKGATSYLNALREAVGLLPLPKELPTGIYRIDKEGLTKY